MHLPSCPPVQGTVLSTSPEVALHRGPWCAPLLTSPCTEILASTSPAQGIQVACSPVPRLLSELCGPPDCQSHKSKAQAGQSQSAITLSIGIGPKGGHLTLEGPIRTLKRCWEREGVLSPFEF